MHSSPLFYRGSRSLQSLAFGILDRALPAVSPPSLPLPLLRRRLHHDDRINHRFVLRRLQRLARLLALFANPLDAVLLDPQIKSPQGRETGTGNGDAASFAAGDGKRGRG
jgi:hypothetical protein